jgi:NADH:ubiquinone oxidoreductase subunit E
MPLETEARAQIRALVADLRPNHGDLLAGLHRLQHEYGYLSGEAMEIIGEQVGMFAAQVYGAASFYDEFRFDPPPATTIRWCSGPACRMRNGGGIRGAMLATLGVKMNGQTDDGRVGVVLGQCNGTCELAPQVWIETAFDHQSRVVGPLTSARAVEMARHLRDGGDAGDL